MKTSLKTVMIVAVICDLSVIVYYQLMDEFVSFFVLKTKNFYESSLLVVNYCL